MLVLNLVGDGVPMPYPESKGPRAVFSERDIAVKYKEANPAHDVLIHHGGALYRVEERASICEEISQSLKRISAPKCIIMNREHLARFAEETAGLFASPPPLSEYLKGVSTYGGVPLYISENVGDQVQVY